MITELNINPNQKEFDWVLNVMETDASSGKVLKAAIPDYRYGIKKITICTGEDDKWIKIGNGTEVLLGPVALKAYTPFTLEFGTIYCTSGNALTFQTESAFNVYMCIMGVTGPPIPAKAYNPMPLDGAENVPIDQILSWDSDNQSVDYNVYIGSTMLSQELVSTQSELNYEPQLEQHRTYFWRVDEVLGSNTCKGEIWVFNT